MTSSIPQLRRMTAADLDFADHLRALVGWNQTKADWLRFLAAEPEGCFVADLDGAPVGTATTIRYGSDLAWIGMVLCSRSIENKAWGAPCFVIAFNSSGTPVFPAFDWMPRPRAVLSMKRLVFGRSST